MANDRIQFEEIDPRRVRLGLAFLVVVVIGALLGALLLENSTGRAVMVLIAVFTIGRAYFLTRSIRRQRGS